MPEVPRPLLAVYVAAAIAIALLGARWLREGGAAGRPAPQAGVRAGARGAGSTFSLGPRGGGPVVVHVAGAVRRPGVYRLAGGARVVDAVRRAGGALRGANTDGVDLAARLADGTQVVVPAGGGSSPAAGAGGAGGGAAAPALAGGAAATPGAGSTGGSGGAGSAGPLSLNGATLEQLDALDGVGPATARKIIAWRQAHGGFASVEDLGRVPGIGPKKLATLRPQLTP